MRNRWQQQHSVHTSWHDTNIYLFKGWHDTNILTVEAEVGITL
jgi:hypothetical protein